VSMRRKIGELSIPMPNPTAPCNVNPTQLHRTTMAISSGDMVGRGAREKRPGSVAR
jgi:hypothetical protein